MRTPFLHGSPVLLIEPHAESDSCALYLMDCSVWPIFREILGCSIPCLRQHPVIIVFEPAAPGHSPNQFRLRWLRTILTGEFARSLQRLLVLFQKGLFSLPVSLSVVPAVLFDGFRLQFVPAGLDHCVQHNLPLWAEGDVMRLLQRHFKVKPWSLIASCSVMFALIWLYMDENICFQPHMCCGFVDLTGACDVSYSYENGGRQISMGRRRRRKRRRRRRRRTRL